MFVHVIVDYIDPSTNRLELCRRIIVKQPVCILLDVVSRFGQGLPVWATDDCLVFDNGCERGGAEFPYTHWHGRVTPRCDMFQVHVMHAAALFTWLAEREDFECTPTGCFYPLERQWNEHVFIPEDFGVYSLLLFTYDYNGESIELVNVFFIPNERVNWVRAEHYLFSIPDKDLEGFRR